MSYIGEIAMAYADCWLDEDIETKLSLRNLHFRSDAWLEAESCHFLMTDIVPEYNEFDADRVFNELSGLDIQIQIARESSVCIYVKGNEVSLKNIERKGRKLLNAQECWRQDDGTLRIWWD